MINVSEMAATKITELLSEEQKAGSGLRVFVQGGGCSGFTIKNPNATSTCGCGQSFSV
jgi:Fe-S cluster assembly iron-binding protein IscA